MGFKCKASYQVFCQFCHVFFSAGAVGTCGTRSILILGRTVKEQSSTNGCMGSPNCGKWMYSYLYPKYNWGKNSSGDDFFHLQLGGGASFL